MPVTIAGPDVALNKAVQSHVERSKTSTIYIYGPIATVVPIPRLRIGGEECRQDKTRCEVVVDKRSVGWHVRYVNGSSIPIPCGPDDPVFSGHEIYLKAFPLVDSLVQWTDKSSLDEYAEWLFINGIALMSVLSTAYIVPFDIMSSIGRHAIADIEREPAISRYVMGGKQWSYHYVDDLAGYSFKDRQAGNQDFLHFGVYASISNSPVGYVGTYLHGGIKYVRVFITTSKQRRGLARAALLLLMPMIGTARAAIDRKNTASIALFTSLGFTRSPEPSPFDRCDDYAK